MSRDPESLSWDQWAEIFQMSVRHFIADVDSLMPDESLPLWRLRNGLVAALRDYERAVLEHAATQDTERLEVPSSPGVSGPGEREG